MDRDQIVERAGQAHERGATELHIVGGLHHKLPFDYYVDVVRWIHEAYPEIHIKAYTGVEIEFFAKIARLSIEEVLRRAGRRRTREPARGRGRDLPSRGPRADLRRQGVDRDLARGPPHGAPARAALERDDALRPHREAQAPDRPPDPPPRAPGRDRRVPDVHPAGVPSGQLADGRDPQALGRDGPQDDGDQPVDARQLPAHQGLLGDARASRRPRWPWRSAPTISTARSSTRRSITRPGPRRRRR